MLRTYVYIISILLLLSCRLTNLHAQDTITVPLKIKVGVEVSGPAIYYSNKNILNAEAYISLDLNERQTVMFAAGYLNYKYSQYNYTYINKGSFVRAGMDFNLLKPDKSQGKYWAGIGLRYGISRFNSEVPHFEKTDYWGKTSSSIASKINWGHFVEVSPGVRTEIFNHLSIGWSISLRMLLYSGTGKDLKPVYLPGFGNGTKTISTGISYYLVWNIPYKKIKVILKKEVPAEEEETNDTGTSGTSGSRQQGKQGTVIRQ
jgi:hypothetical protein